MNFSITGKFDVDPQELEKLLEAMKPHGDAEIARLRELSRLSGLDVVYDLSMFGGAWSPAFRHDVEHPVAWVNHNTGERRAGSDRPAD